MKLRTAFTYLLVWGLACSTAFAAEKSAEDKLLDASFEIMKTERLGGLHRGLSGAEVLKLITCPVKKGKEAEWEADGERHQAWKFPGCGVELDMIASRKGGRKEVNMITVLAPFAGATNRGIKIGSSEQEVKKAYQDYWNKGDSQAKETFVVGSIYGGMIFQFKNGKVDKIFIGAAAE